MKIIFTIVLLLITAACSTKWSGQTSRYFQQSQPTELSKSFDKITVGTGSVMLDSWPQLATDRVELINEIQTTGTSHRKAMKALTVADIDYSVTVSPGKSMLIGHDANYSFYQMEQSVLIERNGNRRARGGIAVAKEGESHKIFWIVPTQHPSVFLGDPDGKILFQEIDPEIQAADYKGFGQTITYLGLRSGQINFVYKEFYDSTLRSAFTQEFSYDYNAGDEYSFKGARFLVHSADPNSITFTQTAQFE